MQITSDRKKAIIFNLSRQASLMEQNAKDLAELGDVMLSLASDTMNKQAEGVRNLARHAEENL